MNNLVQTQVYCLQLQFVKEYRASNKALLWVRSLNAEERVRSRASSREICGGQRGTGTGLPHVTQVFSVGIIPPKFHTHITHICHQGLYNLSNCKRRSTKRHHCPTLTLILTLPIGRTNGRCLEISKQNSALRDLRFSQRHFRSFRSSDATSQGQWVLTFQRVIWPILCQSNLSLRIQAICSSETSDSNHPTTQRHIAEDLNSQSNDS